MTHKGGWQHLAHVDLATKDGLLFEQQKFLTGTPIRPDSGRAASKTLQLKLKKALDEDGLEEIQAQDPNINLNSSKGEAPSVSGSEDSCAL